MALPRLIIHKDEVNILFEPQERQVPVPSLYSLSRRKVAPIVNCDDIEAQTDIIEGSPKDNAAIETLKSLEEMANHLVSLPHMANHSFFSLSFIMSAILFGSAFLYMWIFAFPFHSVNAGLEENRAFFYGVLSYVEFLSLIPWIETGRRSFARCRDCGRVNFANKLGVAGSADQHSDCLGDRVEYVVFAARIVTAGAPGGAARD